MFEEYTAERRPPLAERWLSPASPYLRARWLFLRGLGLVFLSAFYALSFQIHGLIGARGILPAAEFLRMAQTAIGARAYHLVPTLLWFNASDAALTTIVVIGTAASIALVLNLWPRGSSAVAGLCFLSFVGAAQDFASYQSDGMLLEGAFLSLFFAPRGFRPGLGADQPPSRLALFLLQWQWFRIYFQSGLVKLMSGEPQWRNFSAMDKYYENGPLPTWIAWHVQQFPHAFHATTVAFTLLIELWICWLIFAPWRRARLLCFALTSMLQIGIILTANYAFLNYYVLLLGVLMLDDATLRGRAGDTAVTSKPSRVAAVILPIHLATTTLMFFFPNFPTAQLLAPSRIVNNYGLFAVMTRARYEVEFQGSHDGETWTAYPFRYKPDDVREAPRIYAPYQPRFDWNLWFASLGSLNENQWVLNVEARLLESSPDVLRLFAANPFGVKPPAHVRAVLWQYWFTTYDERAKSNGAYWRRELQGLYAPAASRTADGRVEFR